MRKQTAKDGPPIPQLNTDELVTLAQSDAAFRLFEHFNDFFMQIDRLDGGEYGSAARDLIALLPDDLPLGIDNPFTRFELADGGRECNNIQAALVLGMAIALRGSPAELLSKCQQYIECDDVLDLVGSHLDKPSTEKRIEQLADEGLKNKLREAWPLMTEEEKQYVISIALLARSKRSKDEQH